MRQRHVWLCMTLFCTFFLVCGVTQNKPILPLLAVISGLIAFTAWIMLCWNAVVYLAWRITRRETGPEPKDIVGQNEHEILHEEFGDNDQ